MMLSSKEENGMTVIYIIYFILAYMAIHKVWYSKRVYVASNTVGFYVMKSIWAVLFGWFFIPVAFIQILLKK